MSTWSSSSASYMFIPCGQSKIRLDLIESYTRNVNQFDQKESVEVRAISGRTLTFPGPLTEFEALLQRAVRSS